MKKHLVIAGNWKMHKTVAESDVYCTELENLLKPNSAVEIILFPPFTSLHTLHQRHPTLHLGAQNISTREEGALTGEISPLMIKDMCRYVLVGHSERRQVFQETDQDINLKLKVALKHDLIPVLCLGETLEERNQGQTLTKIGSQIEEDFENLSAQDIQKLLIAYEPVWAIGTGVNASPEQAQETHAFIRGLLSKYSDQAIRIPILYGGSVKPDNSHDLLRQPDIDGVLVGGASLKAESFFGIINTSYNLLEE